MRRKVLTVIGALLLVAVMVGACTQPAAPSPSPAPSAASAPTPVRPPTAVVATKWLCYSSVVLTSPFAIALKNSAEWITKQSNGQLELVIVGPEAAPFKAAESLRAVRDGLVQVVGDTTSDFVGEIPYMDVPNLPFLGETYEDKLYVQTQFLPKYQEELDRFKALILDEFISDPQDLWLRTEVSSLKELKGASIRVWSKTLEGSVSGWGSVPVYMPPGEVYTALQRGEVKGAITGPKNLLGSKWYETLKFGYPLSLGYGCQVIVVNRDAFAKLSPVLQKVVQDGVKLYHADREIQATAGERDNWKKLAGFGVKKVDLPAAETLQLRQNAQAVWDGYIKSMPAAAQDKGRAWLNSALDMLDYKR